MGKNKEDEEKYDMCQAIREWAEEERSIGREEGRTEGRSTIVKNMLIRKMSDEEIMSIAECDQEFVDKVRLTL